MTSDVQSVLFDRREFTITQAKAWLRKEGFKVSYLVSKPDFYHFTQGDKSRFKRFRNKRIAKGIELLIGYY